MIRIGGVPQGKPGEDTEFCGLVYPDGDEISKHMAERLSNEPFYQSDKYQQAMRQCHRFCAAVDCGAWVGGWSRALAQVFAKVVSIEANPDSVRCVKKNIAHCTNVTVVNAAVGEVQGVVKLVRGNGANVGTRVADAGTIAAKLGPLDDLREVKALPAIDYIKVHVNGMELQALKGAVETIRKHQPVLTVVLKRAIEPYGDSAEAARSFLDGLGYVPAGGEHPYEIWIPR